MNLQYLYNNLSFRPVLWVVGFVLFSTGVLSASAQDNSYVIGTGDRLSIEVFDEQDLTGTYLVEQDGTISFPFVGRTPAAGISLAALQQNIHSGLLGDYLINPQVSVSINSYRQFFINGEVNQPGGYPFEANMTIQKAVSLAGGLTDFASTRKIYLQREGESEDERTRAELDTVVRPGDIITIGESFF